MDNTVKSDIQAFKMHDNIYFVGSSRVSVHIVATDDGLVMIDTGYPDMYEQIIDSMNELGLDVKNICAVFHSHGHIDHFGCTQKIVKQSGAKTYISRIDNDIVNGSKDLSWAKELGYETLPFFNCDVLIEDGDVFKFGKTSIRCVLTPGHTDGVLSFFLQTENDDGKLVAAMFGGAGFNTLRSDFLERYKLSACCREDMRNSLHKVMDEKVDLVLGNHPGQNDTQGKLKKVLSGECILDSGEWIRFLKSVEKRLDEELAKGM